MAIETEEQFKAWLKEQSQEVCVAIAYRAAMRASRSAPALKKGTRVRENRRGGPGGPFWPYVSDRLALPGHRKAEA